MEQEQEEPKQPFTINEDFNKIPEIDDDKDYFSFISNDDFVTYYGQLLNLRKEVDNFNYPNEEFLEDDGIVDHIKRCNGALEMKLVSILSNSVNGDGETLSNDVLRVKTQIKFNELQKLTAPLIDKYMEEVKVNYIDLTKNKLIFIPNYDGEVENDETE